MAEKDANCGKEEQCKLLLESAERLENEGKLEEALRLIEKVLEMEPSYKVTRLDALLCSEGAITINTNVM